MPDDMGITPTVNDTANLLWERNGATVSFMIVPPEKGQALATDLPSAPR